MTAQIKPLAVVATRPVSRGTFVRRLARKHMTLTIGSVILLMIVVASLVVPLLGIGDPLAINPSLRLKGASAEHWLGTDLYGRDIWSRLLHGGRISLIVGFSVAFLASVGGTLIGLISGFVRKADGIIMRITDGLMSIPPILLAIALMALWGASTTNVILAITIAEIPRVSRLVRGVVLSLREQPYVEAAVCVGARPLYIAFRHVLPNAVAPITVQATFIAASAMLAEAALSFIGAGTPPVVPSWGNMVAEGRALWQIHPGLVFFPSIALSITVIAVNLIGDGLNDILDPRRAGKG